MKEVLGKKISSFRLDKELVQKLTINGVENLGDLWSLTRKDLKNKGFVDHEIQQIIVLLELYGYDLGKRIWKN